MTTDQTNEKQNLIDRWQRLQADWLSQYAPNTVESYRISVARFHSFSVDTPLWRVTPALARSWRDHLQHDERTPDGEPLAPATVVLRLSALSSLFRYAINELAWRGQNPFLTFERPLADSRPLDGLDALDAEAIIGTAQAWVVGRWLNPSPLNWRDLALLTTVYELADVEALDLRWTNDLRWLSLTTQTRRIIDEYLTTAGRRDSIQDGERIFTTIWPDRATRLGQRADTIAPLTQNAANKIVKKWARRAGVDATRARLASLAAAGVDLPVPQE